METEEKLEIAIRPALIEEYIGQKEVKDNMKVFIEAAKIRGESLDTAHQDLVKQQWPIS